MRVCMFGKFDPDYARHAIIRAGLEQAGCQVQLHRYPKGVSTAALIPRIVRDLPRLARQADLFLIPAFNRLHTPAIWLMARLAGKPLWLDYMVGLADSDEDRASASTPRRWFDRGIDRFNTRQIACFTDTAAHRAAFQRLLGQSMDRMEVVPVGARRELLDFQPARIGRNGDIVVQFVGSYIPFHGVDVILKAAALLRDTPRIRFELIGDGQTYTAMQALAADLGLNNVTFRPGFVAIPELLPLLSGCAIYLGVFGDAAKTGYVVPNKVYDGLALGLPVITAESPAVREFFNPGQHLISVPPGDPEALSQAIRQLAASPTDRERLGASGRERIREAFLPEHIGGQLRELFEGAMR